MRNWATLQEVSDEWVSQVSSLFTTTPITCITTWALPSVRPVAALDSYRSANFTVNCACEGSRLHVPYENLMPDDLRWSWGSADITGEWLKMQIIISQEVWLHRDHSKSIACRLISKPYQWVANEEWHLIAGFIVASELIYFNCTAACCGRLKK